MLYWVSRRCSTRNEDPSKDITEDASYFRDAEAYVLLGDPGAGKTRLFKEEAGNTENGFYLAARDFIDLDRDEWRGKVLFIDGLDETRAGRDDPHTPLGALRSKLDKMGQPRFRLSCRAADWHGNSDAEALKVCSPNGEIIALHLEPLTHEQVSTILQHDERVLDSERFLNSAAQFNLEGLLYNPQTLDMLIEAVEGEAWPGTKQEVYELACKKMAVDPRVQRQPHTIPQLLEAAGWLFAVQLLSNANVIRAGNAVGKNEIGIGDLGPPEGKVCQAALGTRLFTSARDGEFTYQHRSIAEYLGARYIAERIKQGLPFSRILSLVTGRDGGVVAALRGLMAWLAACSPPARERLIEIDPLGMVLYGDAQLYSVDSKTALLAALRSEAERTGHLNYNWNTRAFAALTTPDMKSQLPALLGSPSRDKPDQIILDCVLDGLHRASPIPGLQTALMAIIRDSTRWDGVRVSALQVFMNQYPQAHESLIELAEDTRQAKLSEVGNRLLGISSAIWDYVDSQRDGRQLSRDRWSALPATCRVTRLRSSPPIRP